MIIVVDYDPLWLLAFEKLRASVSVVVRDIAISIEHVGSTSVPGSAAKPVIDIDTGVAGSDVLHAIERMGEIGYMHREDLGIPLREAFRSPTGNSWRRFFLLAVGVLCPLPVLPDRVAGVIRQDEYTRDELAKCHQELSIPSAGM